MTTRRTPRRTPQRSARPGRRGRQPYPDDRRKLTTTLPRETIERLRTIGRGNISAAIVWLVDEWEGRAHEILARRE